MTAPLPAPYHLRPTRMADHHAYLRACGWRVARDTAWSGGVWVSDGRFAGWFVSTLAAVRAVEGGWPRVPGRVA